LVWDSLRLNSTAWGAGGGVCGASSGTGGRGERWVSSMLHDIS
jgi:hypothetical protein